MISKQNKNYGFEIKGIDDAEESSDDDADDYFAEFSELKSKKFEFEYPEYMRDTPFPISIVKQVLYIFLNLKLCIISILLVLNNMRPTRPANTHTNVHLSVHAFTRDAKKHAEPCQCFNK